MFTRAQKQPKAHAPTDAAGRRFLNQTISFSNDLIFIIHKILQFLRYVSHPSTFAAPPADDQEMTPCSRAQVAMGSRIEAPPVRRIAASTGSNAFRSTCANIALIGRMALAGMDR